MVLVVGRGCISTFSDHIFYNFLTNLKKKKWSQTYIYCFGEKVVWYCSPTENAFNGRMRLYFSKVMVWGSLCLSKLLSHFGDSVLMGHYSIALSWLLVIGTGVGGCWVLLYVHRNWRLIRVGSPGWPPWLFPELCWLRGGGGGCTVM